MNDSTPRRFWAKVDRRGNDECWPWTGSRTNGYGMMWNGERPETAHRISYQLHRGEIHAGLEIDHLCRNPSCVNPAHLEAVTHAENIRRGDWRGGAHQSAKTHCPKGHPYSGDNLCIKSDGRRSCRTCARDATRKRRASARQR